VSERNDIENIYKIYKAIPKWLFSIVSGIVFAIVGFVLGFNRVIIDFSAQVNALNLDVPILQQELIAIKKLELDKFESIDKRLTQIDISVKSLDSYLRGAGVIK